MPIDPDSVRVRRPDPGDAQQIAGTQARGARLRVGQIDVHDDALAPFIDALERCKPRICLGREAPGQMHQVSRARLPPQFVDRRTAHFAGGADRGAHRWNEDHVSRQQARVARGISVQQQVVQVELGDDASVSLQLDVAQRSNRFHAAAHEQCVGDGCEAAHRVRTGLVGFAHHEDADRAQVAHGNGHLRADHLIRHALLDAGLRFADAQPADGDGTQLREIDSAVAIDDQRVLALRVADQLDVEAVARTDHVFRWHRDVRHRRERGRHPGKQVVAERLQGIGVDWLERQQYQPDAEVAQERLDCESLGRLQHGQAGERDDTQPGQIERPGAIQSVRIAAPHCLDEAIEISLLGLGAPDLLLARGRHRHCRLGQGRSS